jgi:S1-C subfamily serine protease
MWMPVPRSCLPRPQPSRDTAFLQGTSVGIGFAIPIDIVARVVPQLIENGRVIRPSLGVQVISWIQECMRLLKARDVL